MLNTENQTEGQPQVGSDALLAELSRLQREIFDLRKHHDVAPEVQCHLDDAREVIHHAKVAAQFHSANGQSAGTAT